MADVNANIGINLETSAALAQLKDLQRQLAIFNTSINKSTAQAINGQKKLAANLVNAINDTGQFVAQLRNVDTTVESFSKNLEKNKFSIKEYFRFAGASTKTFGASFKSEFDTINKVAEQRVKRLQTQYIKLGRDASGTMQAISVMPKALDMGNYSVQMQMAAQRQALFNQLVKQGSTNLINFGKNTQWAGRQLMVGFTIPLMILGSTASKTFMEMEQAAISFRKVYGDLFTPEPERQQALESIEELGRMFTKYGIAVKDTLGLAADAAAAGFQGLDLQRQTTEATRLSVLGQIDTQRALETTIALQNAFKISSEELAGSINFLNAVENQTVLSLDDVTQAIPRVGPIVQQLGGDIKDLAFFLTAMKEGGVSAAQGANALKSGLASLIAPSEKSAAALMNYGININKIVEDNQGNLRQTVIDFAAALDTLDPLNRSRAIEQLFGKFQFARISALFNNITRDGTQASRVLDLSTASLEELAQMAESELSVVSESTSVKFKAAMEELRLSLLPIGEEFLKAATPIVEFLSGIIERFGNLSDGTKKAITIMIAAIGGLAPIVLMSFGLLNNLIGNAIKFALTLRQGYLKLTGQSNILSQQTNFLTDAQMDALAAAHSLNQSHAGLTQVFNVEREALMKLIRVYQQGTTAAFNFANANRNVMAPGFNPGILKQDTEFYNKGVVMVPGSGNKDTVPAMLTPGEAVIPKEMAKRYAPLIRGMIAGNIPGYNEGLEGDAAFISRISQRADSRSQQPVAEELTKNLSIFNSVIRRATDDTRRSFEEQKRAYMTAVDGLESITKGNLKTVKVIDRFANMGEAGDYEFSHLGTGTRITTAQLRDEVLPLLQQNLRPDTYRTEARTYNALIERRPDFTYSLKDMFAMDIGTNQKLNKAVFGSGITTTDFLADFEPRGTEKWRTMLEGLNLNFDSMQTELNTLDDEITNAIQRSGAQYITDTEANITQLIASAAEQNVQLERSQFISLESISNDIIQRAHQFGDAFESMIQAAIRAITEVRVESRSGQRLGSDVYEIYSTDIFEDITQATRDRTLEETRADARKSAIDSLRAGRGGTGSAPRFRTGGGLFTLPEEYLLPQSTQITANNLGIQAANNVGQGAGTESPSRYTIETGEDLGRGLEIGMQSRMDDVARVANQLGQTAVTESGLIVPKSALPTPRPVITQDTVRRMQMAAGGGGTSIGRGVPFDPNYKVVAISPREITQAVAAGVSGGGTGNNPPTTFDQGPSEEFNESVTNNTQVVKTGTDKLHSMNRMMMTGTFALTSLAGAGQFAGGRLGELSNAVFKVSGLLFALQAVIQLLTDQMIAEIALKRTNNALSAMGVANFRSLFTKGGGIVGFGKNLFTAAKFLKNFIGPLGLLTGAVGLAYLGFKKIKSDQEKQRKAIEGLGDAAKLTADQLKVLSDFFGVVEQKLPSELSSGLFITTPQERTQLEALKENEEFQEKFGDTINALRTARNSEARLTLQTLGLELSARGYATEQIETIIKAIQEEAGKTDVIIDFKSFNIDNYMKDFERSAKKFEKEIENQTKRTYKKVEQYIDANGQVRNRVVDALLPPSNEYKKFENIVATNFANAFDSISGQFKSGIIDAEEYGNRIGKLNDQLSSLSATASRAVVNQLIANLKPEAQEAINALGSIEAKVLATQAAFLGLGVAAELAMLKITQTDAKDRQDYLYWLDQIRQKVLDQQKIIEEIAKVDGTGTGTGDATKELSELEKKTQEVLQRLKSLRDAGINAAGGMKELVRVLARGGTGLNKFNGIAQQMLNMGKVGLNREFIEYITSLDQKSQKAFISIRNGVVKLTKEGRALNKSFNEITLGDISKSYKEQTKDIQAQVSAFHKLRAAGVSTADALKMVENAQWAVAIASAANSKELNRLIRQYNRLQKAIAEQEALDPEAVFNKAYDEAMEYFDLLEQEARLELEPKIELAQDSVDAIQDEIEKIQDVIDEKQEQISDLQREVELNYDRPIEALQREANILSNDLSLLDRAANQINERYDKQEEALTKISEINEDIIAQEKSRISLADALTKGDISAAAQAMQEMRSAQATARQNSAMQALQTARENEISNLRSARGMTRQQIEDRQFEIGQETFRLEQEKLKLTDKIRKIEDEIYDIQENQLEPAEKRLKIAQDFLENLEKELDRRLRNIDNQRREWEKLKNEFELAKKRGTDYNDLLKKMEEQTGKVAKQVEKIKKDWESIKDKKAKLEIEKICTVDPSCCECGEHKGGNKNKSKNKSNISQQDSDSDGEDDEGGFVPLIPPGIPNGPGVNAIPQVPGQIPGNMPGQTPGSAPGAQSSSASQVGSQNTGSLSQSAAATADASKSGSLVLRADTRLAPAKKVTIIPQNTKQTTTKTTSTGSKTPQKVTIKPVAPISPRIAEQIQKAVNTPKPQSTSVKQSGQAAKNAARGAKPLVTVQPRGSMPAPKVTVPRGGLLPILPGGGGPFGFQLYAAGGYVKPKYFARGSLARGTDTVPAMLTPGEFVMRKYAVKDFGLDRLKAINSGTYNDGSVYNYNLNLNVKSDANPDEIAQVVMTQIKRVEGQRIRGNRF